MSAVRERTGGLTALCLIARLHHVAADPATLSHQLGLEASQDATVSDLLLAAKRIGLKAKLIKSSAERLTMSPLPALDRIRNAAGRVNTVVLAQCDGNRVLLQNPAAADAGGRPTIESIAEFQEHWTGELILITSRASLAGELAKFDFSWFIPSLVKHRKLLGEVLLISFMLQLFALVSPLFFQVVMDKVLVHRGLTTLDVLIVGLVVIVVFESLLNGLRSYVFSHTTNRIDVELGAKLFRHLMHLPLAYFQARRVGDSVARIRELENIRSFLTGNALTVVLDVVFSIVFISVMLFYSVPLTLIVLVSLPLYFGLSLAIVPILKRRLDELERDLATQQARLQEALAASREAEQTRRAYIAEVRRALSERNMQADLKQEQTFQEFAKATYREQLTTLTAPVTGTVQQLAVHTEGGVVTEAQPLMVIVPDSAGVIAEVTLENKDIGFVSAGQEVAIKLETFPFTRYGTVKAKVEKVTQDAVNDEKRGAIFPALVSLNETHIKVDGSSIRISPGMNVTAEIKTGRRRLIEYLLSSIQRTGTESLRER